MSIKKYIISLVVIASLFLNILPVNAAQSVFQSSQIGSTPVAGTVLQTDGVNSNWVATSTLNFGGGGGGGGGGTNYLTNSGANTYLNTGVNLQAPVINATSSATSTIQNLNYVFTVPADFVTNGCAGDPTKTDFGSCVNALYALASSTGIVGARIEVRNNVAAANWITPIAFNIIGVVPSLVCTPGTTLQYGGNPVTNGGAVTFNFGNPIGHLTSDDYGCTYMGHTTRIAAGQTNTSTTTGIFLGAAPGASVSQGAVAVDFHDNNVNGFGTNIEIGSNSYMLALVHNSISGGNGSTTSLKGSLLHLNTSSNSGERLVVDGNNFTDPGNSVATSSIYIENGSNASAFFTNNSIDDAAFFVGASNGQVVINNNHFENAAYTNYGPYIPILGVSSDKSTQITFNGNEIANDTSGANSFQTIIKHGGQLTAIGNHIDNYDGGTINTFSDHSLDNGVESELICQTQVQGGSLTNLVGGGGSQAYSLAAGATCITDVANSYPVSIQANQNNIANIRNGSQNVATFDQSGNWTFLKSITVPVASPNATSSISNLAGTLDASTFAGSDIGAQVNAAYLSCPFNGCIIMIPQGSFFFSTPIVLNTLGKRALIRGAPAEGTQLFYTGGAGAAITIDTGIQASGVDHTTGNGIDGIFLHGNSYSTTTPEIGVFIGGAEANGGCDGCVLNATNVFHFGYGIQTGANAYHFLLSNSTIRDNGQNIHLNGPANNSGEAMDFINDFIVDGANSNAVECFYADDYSAATINITGGSIDDCQVHLGIQIANYTETGVHHENAGSAWGKYTYMTIGDSAYTNVVINGGLFINNRSGATAPDQFIQANSAGVVLNGLTLFNNGSTVTNLLTSTGNVTWSGLNNAGGGGGITNIMSGTPFSVNGSTGTSVYKNFNASGALSVGSNFTTFPFAVVKTTVGNQINYFQNLDGLANDATSVFLNTRATLGDTSVGSQIQSLRTNANSSGDNDLVFQNSAATTMNTNLIIKANSNIGAGTTTPVANVQFTNKASNATTTAEFGKANQTLGTCLKFYRSDGSAIYASVLAGATAFTLSTTACATVSGF